MVVRLVLSVGIFLFGSMAYAADLNKIKGTWSQKDKNGCKDSIIFSTDGTFTTISKDEVTTGTYSFSAGEGRDQLNVTVRTDNKQADCKGRQSDSVGDQFTIYISFTTVNMMNWHMSPDDEKVVMTLGRE